MARKGTGVRTYGHYEHPDFEYFLGGVSEYWLS